MRSVHPRFEINDNFAFEEAATGNSIDEVAQAKNGSTHANLPSSSTTSEGEKVAGSLAKAGDDVGKYTTKIRWGIQDVDVRPFEKGYWGKRVSQSNPRVDALS